MPRIKRKSPSEVEEKPASQELSDEENIANADKSNYFQTLQEESFKRSKIAKNTSKPPSSLPPLEVSEMKSAVDRYDDQLTKFLKPYSEKITQSLWGQWKIQLDLGFNLVFFGFGSKKKHLEKFVLENFQQNHHVFVFNGYFPVGSLETFTESVKRTLSNSTSKCTKVIVLVHNIEGDSSFNGPSCLTFLITELQQLNRFSFKFIFSIDHVNASFLLGSLYFSTSNCNLLVHELTTWMLYEEETSFENSLTMKAQSGLGLRPLRHILQSVTANARSLFALLAKMQLEEESCSQGIPFQVLFQRGKDEFLFGNELVFRTLLGEFIDHKAIVVKKSNEDVDLLQIPMNREHLVQIQSEIE